MTAVLEVPDPRTAKDRFVTAQGVTPPADDFAAFATANSTEFRQAHRSQPSSVECRHAAHNVLLAIHAGGSSALSKPGSLEVALSIPLCDRVKTEIHRAIQASGTTLDGLRFREVKNRNVEVSWNGRNSMSHFS